MPINPIGKANIGAPVIGEIQSKAVIMPMAIATFPKMFNFFSIEFSTIQNYQFFYTYCHPEPLFSGEGSSPLMH